MNKIEKLIQELCPNGVEWKTLGEVCVQICSGGTPNSKTSAYYGGDIPWLRTQEVNFCDIYTTEMTITKDGLDNSSAKWIPANCVIVAMYGATVGKIGINKIPLTTNQACCNLQINSEIALYRYVFYCLCSQYEYIKSLGEGSQTNINAQIVRNLQIPLPPLPVQTEIVRILDKFVEQQEQLEKLIELRKKQYEYYREEMLTAKEGEEWETKTLEEICSFVRGPFGGALKKEIFVESGFAVYEQQNAIYGNLNFRYFVDENKFNQMKSFHIHVGDLIMSCSGTMGKIFIIPENAPQGIINQALLKLTPKRNFSGKFIKKYIESNCFQKQLAKQTQGGAIQNVASVQILKKLLIDVPSFEKQNEIVNALDSFESSISALTSALELSKKRYEHYRDEMLRF